MFDSCENLENLDVSNFNTKNSVTFEQMFFGCKKLKNIDVSKFDSSKCKSINSMFRYCENITQINMSNWDMSHLKAGFMWNNDLLTGLPGLGIMPSLVGIVGQIALGLANPLYGIASLAADKDYRVKENSINYLFDGCKNLKLIKMSCNFMDINNLIYGDENNEIFKGLPPEGSFYWKKGLNCDKLLSQLPVSWNRFAV